MFFELEINGLFVGDSAGICVDYFEFGDPLEEVFGPYPAENSCSNPYFARIVVKRSFCSGVWDDSLFESPVSTAVYASVVC